jgi:hypothetical protein
VAIYQVSNSYVASHHFGAQILPPDGKSAVEEGAEVFWFSPSMKAPRALDEGELSLLSRCRIQLSQRPQKPLHIAAIHDNLLIVDRQMAELIEELSPGIHQILPLNHVWFRGAKDPSPGLYCAVLVLDYAHTVDLERADVQRHYVEHLGVTSIWLAAVFPERRIIRAETGLDRHIWAADPTGAVFCSDAFRNRAMALPGLVGAVFQSCTET